MLLGHRHWLLLLLWQASCLNGSLSCYCCIHWTAEKLQLHRWVWYCPGCCVSQQCAPVDLHHALCDATQQVHWAAGPTAAAAAAEGKLLQASCQHC
jgi:hypothetical protein